MDRSDFMQGENIDPRQMVEYEKDPFMKRLVAQLNEETRIRNARGGPDTMYPRMIYRAQRNDGGKFECMTNLPNESMYKDPQEYRFDLAKATQFNNACQFLTRNEEEFQRMTSDTTAGWVKHPLEAVPAAIAEQHRIATETAHRHYEDEKMSDKAKVEIQAFERENFGHQPVIPEQRLVKKRGRPKKVAVEA